jgi:hypothetical protein
MKNKKMTYILIPLVALVWGLIFWKIYNHFTDKEDAGIKSYTLLPNKVFDSIPDTIRLLLNYRDPFLSYTYRPGNLIRAERMERAERMDAGNFNRTIAKPEINWPNIKYGGMIWNNKTKSKTGLLTFNNQNLLVKEGQLIEGYKISKLYSDSVTLEYNKMKKAFKR